MARRSTTKRSSSTGSRHDGRVGGKATPLQAKRLHAALLSCRWVAAPCPSWGVAYAEAMGAHARQRIVAVEPTWLAFSDAWGGEVEAFWREAVKHLNALYLLIFADDPRPCPRAMLGAAAARHRLRLRTRLPSGLPWPENLRVISCPSVDEAALHVPNWVVAHWAGVAAASGENRRTGRSPPARHVPGLVQVGRVAERHRLPLTRTRNRGAVRRAGVCSTLASVPTD